MPTFIRLIECENAEQKKQGFANRKLFYNTRQSSLLNIPGHPIAYWVSQKMIDIFATQEKAAKICITRTGMATGNNSLYTRVFWEISLGSIGRRLTREQSKLAACKWFPYSNGGASRKWYGNNEDVVNWGNDGKELQTSQHESGRIRAHNFNLDVIFSPAATWSLIGMTATMVRYIEKGALFSSGAPSLFAEPSNLEFMLAILNTKICKYFQDLLNPTINANSGDVLNYPIIKVKVSDLVKKAISISKLDWDLRENSMDFLRTPLLTAYESSCKISVLVSCPIQTAYI